MPSPWLTTEQDQELATKAKTKFGNKPRLRPTQNGGKSKAKLSFITCYILTKFDHAMRGSNDIFK